MKPFDLEAAKRGEALITRSGHKAEFIGHAPNAGHNYKVVALIDLIPVCFAESGKLIDAGSGCPEDLFMAPKKKTVWVNLYESFGSRESISSGYVYDTEMLANANCESTRIGSKAWPLEIEE